MAVCKRWSLYIFCCVAGCMLFLACSTENTSKPDPTDGDADIDLDLEEAMDLEEPAEEEDGLREAEEDLEIAEEEVLPSDFTIPDIAFPTLPGQNTEGATYESMYALSMADGSVAVLWINAQGLRYNRTTPDRSAWLGEKMLLSLEELGEYLKPLVAPPRDPCIESSADVICYEEPEWEHWKVSAGFFEFHSTDRPHRLWQDDEGYFHLPVNFGISNHPNHIGILDMRLSNETLATDFVIIRDFGREANQLLDQGRNIFEDRPPAIHELEWGRDAHGCGVALYAYGGLPYPTSRKIYLVRQVCCQGVWGEPEMLYKVRDAPGEGDGYKNMCCPPYDPECLEKEEEPYCMTIRDIMPTIDHNNRFVSPVMLDLQYGGPSFAHVAVYPERAKPRARVIASYRYEPEEMFSWGALASYTFGDGETWLLGTSYTSGQPYRMYSRRFTDEGFTQQQSMFFTSSNSEPYWDLLGSFASDPATHRFTIRSSISGKRIIEMEHRLAVDEKAGSRVIHLEDDNPAFETPEGTWEDLAVFNDEPGRQLLVAQRVLPPFAPEQNFLHGKDRGMYSFAFHNIMVYQEDDTPWRKDIAGIVNTEGFRWNYAEPWWLDTDTSGPPLLLMTQGPYVTVLDALHPEKELTLLPPAEIPMGDGVAQHNAGGVHNGVTINGCRGECNVTDIIRLDTSGELQCKEVRHFENLDEGACTAQSTADGLTLYTCRGEDPYAARSYSTRYCDDHGTCTGHREFAPLYFAGIETTLFSHSRGHAAVSLLRDQQTGEQHFQLWLSENNGETWDFLGFDSIGRAGAIQWAPLGDNLVGIATRCISPDPCRMRPFTLTPGAGIVQWGDAAIPGTTDGSQGLPPEIAVRSDGMMLLLWKQRENKDKCFAALYDPQTDAFSEAQSIAMPSWATSIRTVRPFINDSHYCIAMEVFRRVEEQEGNERTQTMWGCRAFEDIAE